MLKKRRNSKAQSMTDYILLLAIVTAALVGMQVYMKRGIHAVVKAAADELGDQKKGAVDYDYRFEYKEKRGSNVTSSTSGQKITTMSKGGAVTYDRPADTTTQTGELFYGLAREKE